MITKIDQSLLQYYLPFTRDVKGSIIYKSYEQGLAMADEKLKNDLLGLALYVKLSKAWSGEEQPENEALADSDYRIGCTLEQLKGKVAEYICNEAAYLTLGHHNVMQSSVGGFTTATGSQEVVASQTRVNDLRDECRKTAESAFGSLLLMLIGNSYTEAETRKSVRWIAATKHFIWTREHALQCVGDIALNPADMARAKAKVETIISPEQTKALIEEMRSGEVTEESAVAIELIRGVYAAELLRSDEKESKHQDMRQASTRLIAYLDEHPDSFPAYHGSMAYEALHTSGYKNEPGAAGYWL